MSTQHRPTRTLAPVVLALALAMAAPTSALAADFLAFAPFDVDLMSQGHTLRVLEGGDTLSFVVVPKGEGLIARLERRRPDLSLAWSQEVPVEVTEKLEIEGQFGRTLYTPMLGWAQLDVAGAAIGVFTWAGGELWRVGVDAATGALQERQSLGPMSAPSKVLPDGPAGELAMRAPVAQSASGAFTAVGAGHGEKGLTIRVIGANQKVVAQHELPAVEAIVAGVSDEGAVTVLAPAPGGGLSVRTLPLRGKGKEATQPGVPWMPERTSTALGPSGMVIAVRPAVGKDDSGRSWLVLLRDLNEDDPIVTLAIGDPAGGFQERSITRRTLNEALSGSGEGKERDAAWLGVALLEANPDGSALVGLRTTAIVETTTTKTTTSSSGMQSSSTSTSISYEAGDLLLVRVERDGSLAWTRRVDVAARGGLPDYFAFESARTADGIRVLYRDNQCHRGMGLCTRLIDPATGEASQAQSASPSVPSGAFWLPELTHPLTDSTWVIGFRQAQLGFEGLRQAMKGETLLVDGGVLTRVDLLAPPPLSGLPPAPSDAPVLDGLDYRSGAAFGRMSVLEAKKGAGARGFGVGVGVGAVAGGLMLAGMLQDEPSPALIAGGMFGAPIGGAIAARLVIKPTRGWWTNESADFQAGYLSTARRHAGRRGAFGGAVGSMPGIIVGLVAVGVPVALLSEPEGD